MAIHNRNLEGEIQGELVLHTGTPGPPGYTPVKGVDYFTPDEIDAIIEEIKKSVTGGVDFKTDATLELKNGILSVNTTNDMEKDNMLPITSSGMYSVVGNIEALLKTV